MGEETKSRMAEKKMDASEKVRRAIGTDGITAGLVHVSGFKNVDGVTYYKLTAQNDSLIWQHFLRFSDFSEFYDEVVRIWEARVSISYRLPPFPEKSNKVLTDHLDQHFIRERLVLLDNFVCSLSKSKTWRHSKVFQNFVTPAPHSVDVFLQVNDSKDADGKDASSVIEKDISVSSARKSSIEGEDVTMMEVTDVNIPNAQVLRNDHVIYQVDVKNKLKSNFNSWVVLKRFQEFYVLDQQIRQDAKESCPEVLSSLPPLPSREPKLLVNHLDNTFIEKRRLLLESYLRVLIETEHVKSLPSLLEFLGV